MYGILRFFHLVVAACVLPVAGLYLRDHYPEYFATRGGWLIFILLWGGIFWGLFFIVFTQRYFPFSLRGALLAVTAMLLNGFAGMQLGAFDPFYGAYSVLMASVAALFIYFTTMSGIFLLPRVRPRFFYYHDWPAYILLPLVMGVSMGFMFATFWPPLPAEFREEPTWYGRSVYVLLFGADVLLSAARIRSAKTVSCGVSIPRWSRCHT